MTLLDKFICAIEQHEGYFPPCRAYPKGSRSYRNNNPANFRYNSFVKDLGAIDKDSGGFAIFLDIKSGRKALKDFVKLACTDKLKAYKAKMTIKQFFAVYAPSSDGNNVDAYANAVANNCGVLPTAQIGTLLA